MYVQRVMQYLVEGLILTLLMGVIRAQLIKE